LADALAVDGTAGAGLTLRLRARQEQGRKGLKEWSDRYDRLYDEAVHRDFDPLFLLRWADELLEKERAARARLHSLIETLQLKIAEDGGRIDVEAQDLVRASIDAANAWITPYQTLRAKLLKLASERRIVTGEISRARPVEGEIDYAELTRQFIARFPKILAALAK
jgi:hypothetical protein